MRHAIPFPTARVLAIVARAALLAGFAGSLAAAPASIDVDGDLMRGIDDTTKSLDSDVLQKDAKAATAEARELAELFARIEAHYAEKGDAPDAVGFAQKARQLAARAQSSIEAGDFEAASDTVGDLTRACKACHQVYKKER